MNDETKLLPRQEEQHQNPPTHSTLCAVGEQVSIEEAIRQTCFGLYIHDDVAEQVVGGTLARLAPVFDSPGGLAHLVESVDPGSSIESSHNIHEVVCVNGNYRWHRSRAKAEEILAAIVSRLGGRHAHISEGGTGTSHWLTVSVDDGATKFSVFYSPDEAAQ